MSGLTLQNIQKQYKDSKKAAVNNINLHIDNNEFLVLLGPSGCGKTTLLKMVLGLIKPTEGNILIDDEDVTNLEPQERKIGMVFQNYALYPHMNVHKNLSFALKIAKIKKTKCNKIINEVGNILNIAKHFSKKPHMLSGGERQRVAIGRAMVKDCKMYLFDEPLSNLDDILRTKLRPEIIKLFHDLKVPFVYVTHDQVDAMTMGTKIAVMKDGEIQQLGTPQEVYNSPINMFVASFVGMQKINFIEANVTTVNEKIKVVCNNLSIELLQYNDKLKNYIGDNIIIGIRPEDFFISNTKENLQPISCLLTHYEHLGNKINLFVDFNNNTLCINTPVTVKAKVDEKITVYLDTNKIYLFDSKTQLRL